MIIAGIDTETTGLEIGDHRFVEVYIGLYDRNGRKLKDLNQRIDPQRSISIEAQRVHGISTADLAGKPIWQSVAPIVQKYLEKASCFVWHNGDDFDGPFLKYELERVGCSLPARPTLDTMKAGTWATHDGKKPTLGELCFACGVPYDPAKAHAADYDVDRMVECYFRGVRWGFYKPVWELETAQAATSQPTPVAA